MINADLHSHSRASDGVLSPSEVAGYAKRGAVTLWSLTDHDELSGQDEARRAAAELEIQYLGGVEISVTWAGQTIHVVGLGIDTSEPGLVAGLAKTRSGRYERARRIAEKLDEIGIEGSLEGALQYVGNPALISRTHFARHLVDSGAAPSVAEVFKRYLSEGRPGYVPHRWASLEEAAQWIAGAGGVAVLAHPGRYAYTQTEFAALFEQFLGVGGVAIEVVTGSHTPDQYREYAAVARKYRFEASRGSDFHAPGEGRLEPGTLPPLPEDLTPVWHRWC